MEIIEFDILTLRDQNFICLWKQRILSLNLKFAS